jgi:hypothetical protein
MVVDETSCAGRASSTTPAQLDVVCRIKTVARRSTSEGHDMTATFEHKVLKFGWGWKGFDYAAMERELNELGAQGWETVGTIVPSVGAGQSIEIGVVLKRTVG